MKKFLILLFSIFFITMLFSKTITVQYTLTNPTVKNLQNGYSEIDYKNSLQTAKIGNPCLPYLPIKILLPAGEIAKSVEIIKMNKKELSGSYKLYPYQGVSPYTQNSSKIFKKNQEIYQSDDKYPFEYNKNFTTQFMNGYSILLSSYTPLEYIPKSGKISYFKNIKIVVQTEKTSKANEILKNLSSLDKIKKRVKEFVDNPEMVYSYPSGKNRAEYDILLITSSDYEDDFDDYITLYNKMGYKTRVHTVQEIESNVSGNDLPEKIRNFIIEEYQNSGISFVTLAGDVEIVPYRGFYCQVQSSQVYEDSNIPADLYYSALDGSWNENNNSYWGEPEEADLLPDISVARLSFSNINDLNAILHKITSYTQNPVEGELQKPLLVGENLWDDPLTWGGDYLDLLIGHHEDNGYTTDGIPETDNIQKLYDRDIGTWNVGQLLDEINSGASFIHHSGHSNFNYNLRMGISEISDNTFSAVNGTDHNYTLVYSHGCVSAGFDYDDCIAERMVDIDNFAVAYIGNSRYGWFNEGTTEGPSEHLHREFINALYGEQIGNLGTAHLQSKVASSWWVTAPGQYEEGALRWCFYDCNVLGDPALFVWTKEPISIDVNYPSTVTIGENQINVQVSSYDGNINNLRCAVIKDNQLVGVGVTDQNGNATVTLSDVLIPGPAHLFVSGYNCKLTEYDIVFTSPNQAYPYPVSYQIETTDDDTLEFGETATIGFTIRNAGDETAENITASISSDDEFIQVSDNVISLSDLGAGEETVIPNDSFSFDISSQIPLEYQFQIDLHISYNNGEESIFPVDLVAYNSNIELIETHFDNSDDVIQPGETVDLLINLKNESNADLDNPIFTLSSQSQYVTIQNPVLQMDELNAGNSLQLSYSITASANTPFGQAIDFAISVSADNQFEQEITFQKTIGLVVENFETGDFSQFNWHFTGNAEWSVVNQNPYEGNYCAKSGDITDNQSSAMFVVYNVTQDSPISFAYKVSSEDSYDFLKFFIDGTVAGEWSGEEDWAMASYDVSVGTHIFRWVYVKDAYVSNGEDAAWVDDIVFPISQSATSDGNQIQESENYTKVFPNPFVAFSAKNTYINISFSMKKKDNLKLSIYNLKGELIKSEKFTDIQKGTYKWDMKDKNGKQVASGIYFYRLKNKATNRIGKITILK